MADKEEQRTGNKCYKPSSTTKTVNLGDGNRAIRTTCFKFPSRNRIQARSYLLERPAD